jgi:hypothetical protein
MARMSYVTTMRSVHDAKQRCIGFVMARGKSGYEAFNADERSLGLFRGPQDAADAVLDAARSS